jgi:hypothetical protein
MQAIVNIVFCAVLQAVTAAIFRSAHGRLGLAVEREKMPGHKL